MLGAGQLEPPDPTYDKEDAEDAGHRANQVEACREGETASNCALDRLNVWERQ
jgi:hypothetical protein